jgi:hypothetical protein
LVLLGIPLQLEGMGDLVVRDVLGRLHRVTE